MGKEPGCSRQRSARAATVALLVVGALTAALARSAPARAEVLLDWQSNGAGLVVEGAITPQTLFELAWAELVVAARHGETLAYVLDSPGGDVETAMQIANYIHKHASLAIVMRGAECASSCVLLLTAAEWKLISPDAAIGIHRARVGEDTTSMEPTEVTQSIALRYAKYGVPQDLIQRLLRTPASAISWLTPRDLVRLPGARVRKSIPFAQVLRRAVTVNEYDAGYSAGAYIAARKWDRPNCQFAGVFQAGCIAGFRDAPPPGWAMNFLKHAQPGQ